MKAINIQWDVTNEDYENYDWDEDCEDYSYDEIFDSLPTEIDIPDGIKDEDEISDYLTDMTGYCHYGFDLVD